MKLQLPGRSRSAATRPSAAARSTGRAVAQRRRQRQRAALRSWVGRVPLLRTLTTIGWWALAAIVIAAALGWLLGWAEFRVFAVLVAVLLLLAIPFMLAGQRHDASLTLHSPRVRVGDQGQGRLTLRSRDGSRIGGQRIEFPVGSAVASFRVSALSGDGEFEQLFAVEATRRGVVPIGPALAIRSDPVGLLSRRRVLTDRLDLFVHPRVVLVESAALGFLRDIEGVTTKNLSSSDVSFHGLRDYTAGDDRRAVHWRSTARTGRLIVRQFTETMRAHLLIVLSTRPDEYETADDFELAISVAASIGVSALRQERRVSVATSTRLLTPLNPSRLLDEFCRLEADPGAPSFSFAVGQAVRAVPGASVAAFVGGGNLRVDEIGVAQFKLSPDVVGFAVRCGDGLGLARRRVGRITVVDVADLDELGRGLRAVA